MASVSSWLLLICLGGISGLIGQGVRVVVGLKKLNDEASATQSSLSQLISPSRLLVSLLLGFLAGAIAAISMQAQSASIASVARSDILAFMAAGYTGADFIEGVMSRFLPTSTGAGNEAAGAGNNKGVAFQG